MQRGAAAHAAMKRPVREDLLGRRAARPRWVATSGPKRGAPRHSASSKQRGADEQRRRRAAPEHRAAKLTSASST